MSISNRFLGGKAFGFLLSSKKTRFDPNSIDLLLSMDRIERGAVVNLFTLVRFSERLARRQTWNVQKLKMDKMEAALKAIRDGATTVNLRGARECSVARERARAFCAITRFGLRSRPAGVGPSALREPARWPWWLARVGGWRGDGGRLGPRPRPAAQARPMRGERARASCAIARFGLRSRPAGVGPRACASAPRACAAPLNRVTLTRARGVLHRRREQHRRCRRDSSGRRAREEHVGHVGQPL